jgi:UDPglucose--hexose-1-phosphate uridylyltransferase
MADRELRTCPFGGRRVLVAAGRTNRPGGGLSVPPLEEIDPAQDPFAEGAEERTPPELDAARAGGAAPDGPGWQVRVVPTRFPLVAPDAPAPAPEAQPDLFGAVAATGEHEVIIQSPRPVVSLSQLSAEEVEGVVRMWQQRLRAHADAPARHLILNERPRAGASQPHSHAQLLTFPIVPAELARERERAAAYTLQTMGGDLTADLLQEEVRRRERIVAIDDDTVLLAPWASRAAYHLTILPRRAALRFEDQPDGIGGRMLHLALSRLAERFGTPVPLNGWVRTAVAGAERTSWRIELLPALEQRGGVELGAGIDVCTVPPEQAAAELRAA